MKKKFENYVKYYDAIYTDKKDYAKESKNLKTIIRKFNRNARTLLDVACGTGNHLKHLSKSFDCYGLDIDKRMLKIARKKNPRLKFFQGDMTKFRLKKKFDVITCMFSAIGDVKTIKNIEKTFRTFYKHLNPNGIVILEPWIFKKDFRKNYVGLDVYEHEGMKAVRMAASNISNNMWNIKFYYLIGDKGKIMQVEELHKMLLADKKDYLKSIKKAGFRKTTFIESKNWGRGIFVCIK